MAQPQKRRPESARRANRIIQTRTLLLLGVFGVLTFVLLFAKLYHWQITEHDELQSVAVRQQTLRTTVEASRGTIYDRNGTILAMSASAEDIFLSPKEIVENDQDQNLIANGLAEILNLDAADILKKMEKTNSQYEILKKKADDELADKVREFINKNELRGVFLRPTSKRSYPKGTLASQVIGFANDNGGSMGLEATYNDVLTGENGMVVTARDRDGRSVLYQYDQYFDAENGCDLHTTLDTTIQYYLEKGVQELEARFGTGKGATGIVMDVNTGAVLAMASLPTYDLNAPGKVYNDFLTSGMTEEQIEENMKDLLNKQWRSKAINDTYEPGSTFKTLTLAMALEENVVDLNTGFYCGGNTTIEGQKIWCSKRTGHGQQNLTQAFANSCNPAFINIGLRVGNAKFYQYMQDFGLLEKTGIDTTGEASGFANSEIKYSTLALACYAFGQNFNVTPVALLAAQCACVNGGYLYTPYLVEEITDQDGNETTLYFGNVTGDSYYLTLNEKKEIYTVSTGVIEDFQYSMEDMAQLDTFPTIGSGNLKKVVISQGTEKTEYSSENDDDAKSMATIAGGLGVLTLKDAADYSVEENDLSKYGLDEQSRTTETVTYTLSLIHI